jgi:hypothetical protein
MNETISQLWDAAEKHSLTMLGESLSENVTYNDNGDVIGGKPDTPEAQLAEVLTYLKDTV